MTPRGEKPLVLFLCTANSARSQMAEAILRHRAGDRFEAASAGMEPTQVHPLTLRALEEAGIDAGGLHSKHAGDFLGKVAVRHAIIVCERAQRSCPRLYPFATRVHVWPFEDPAEAEGGGEARLEKFREVRNQIAARIEDWLVEVEREAGDEPKLTG